MLSSNKLPLVSIIILYLYLYNPIFKPGFAFGSILILISLLYCVLNYSLLYRYLKFYHKELSLSLLMMLYLLIVYLLMGFNNFGIIGELFKWLIFCTIVPIFIVNTIVSRFNNISFWDGILDIGFIASIISCAALFIPSFNNFIRGIQVDVFSDSDVIWEQMSFRGFGLSNYLTSSYGYIQGLLASLCLLKFDTKHKRYALYFITIFISVITNARTGIFPIVLAIIYLLYSNIIRLKLYTLVKIVLLSSVVLLILARFLNSFPDIANFIFDFFNQISFILIEGGFVETTYSKMLFLPQSNTGLIFGEGHSVFGLDDAMSSDIGYINQIFIGGIIFASLLLIYEIYLYVRIRRMSQEKVFSTIFFISVLVFNFKGVPFYSIVPFINLWMLYYYTLVFNQMNINKSIRLF